MLASLPSSFAATRDAMHALAEHVVAAARYQAEQRIGLRVTPGGFGTPAFGDGERVRVAGIEVVHERPGSVRRIGITTLGDAAHFVGVPLGMPPEVYPPATPRVDGAPLAIEPDAAHVLADWYAFADGLLAELRDEHAAHDPSEVQLWPEHFDLACDLGDADAGTRANYGASPGDGAIGEPYLYVGPWDTARRTGALAAHPFGAAITYHELQAAPDTRSLARTFFADAAALLLGAT